LSDDASDLERAELAIAMLWPLARRVFLMHRVDDLSYREISAIVGIDELTVEICIFDALIAVAGARRGEYVTRTLTMRGLKEVLGYGRR
jgi:RNA polymerase sigma-70 factor (ECF subfamily)